MRHLIFDVPYNRPQPHTSPHHNTIMLPYYVRLAASSFGSRSAIIARHENNINNMFRSVLIFEIIMS
jgi:hypothetical protein